MGILWVNLGLVYSFSLLARYFSYSKSHFENKPNMFFVLSTMLCLILVSGLRSNIGDTYYYMHAFVVNEFTLETILGQKDIGFGLLQMIIKQYTNDPQVLIFLCALITNLLIVLVVYHYSRLIELSLYIYITSGLFLVSMNGIRQFVAAAILFAGTKFILNGDWIKFLMVVLFASAFHQSALIMIPVYFVVRTKAWSKATLYIILGSFVFAIGFEQTSSLFFKIIEDTQYGHYVEFEEGGANYIRVGIYSLPIIAAFLARNRLGQIFPYSDYLVNLSIIGLVFMIISTQNWIFARFSIYFSLYQLILITWIVKSFRHHDQKFVYYLILIFYALFFYYEHVVTLNVFYKSDFIQF
ncbi:EpsG family protein [Pseudalkalibacillus sp. SCS-8]|uniref:EpsG family protein n=1 Tax=Pseudalkalibacillus nanhaiensis TaxID=3115291 RepID=UPI0032DA6044